MYLSGDQSLGKETDYSDRAPILQSGVIVWLISNLKTQINLTKNGMS